MEQELSCADWELPSSSATRFMIKIAAAATRQNGVVFTGPHHYCIIRDIVAMGFAPRVNGEHGFLTTENKFVGRKEARKIAEQAGQIRFPLDHNPDSLFSEELWRVRVDHPTLEEDIKLNTC